MAPRCGWSSTGLRGEERFAINQFLQAVPRFFTLRMACTPVYSVNTPRCGMFTPREGRSEVGSPAAAQRKRRRLGLPVAGEHTFLVATDPHDA